MRKRRKFSAKQLANQRRFAAAARARGRKANPSRRRKAHHAVTVHHKRRRSNPVRAHTTHRRRRRHNPISLGNLSGSSTGTLLKNAAIGGAGAVGVDAALALLPVPATWLQGWLGIVTKSGAAILLGAAAHKFGLRGGLVAKAVEGSLTVTAYKAIVSLVGPAGMGVPLAGLGYFSPARQVQLPGAARMGTGAMGIPNVLGRYFNKPAQPMGRYFDQGLTSFPSGKVAGFNL